MPESVQTEEVPVECEVDPGVGQAVESHQPVQRLHVHHLSGVRSNMNFLQCFKEREGYYKIVDSFQKLDKED